ncbi:MAG: hypothetical protein ACOC0A_02615, partial [Planctomycetota bacterium]
MSILEDNGKAKNDAIDTSLSTIGSVARAILQGANSSKTDASGRAPSEAKMEDRLWPMLSGEEKRENHAKKHFNYYRVISDGTAIWAGGLDVRLVFCWSG